MLVLKNWAKKEMFCLIENYIPKKYGGLIFKHDVFAYNLFCMPPT